MKRDLKVWSPVKSINNFKMSIFSLFSVSFILKYETNRIQRRQQNSNFSKESFCSDQTKSCVTEYGVQEFTNAIEKNDMVIQQLIFVTTPTLDS